MSAEEKWRKIAPRIWSNFPTLLSRLFWTPFGIPAWECANASLTVWLWRHIDTGTDYYQVNKAPTLKGCKHTYIGFCKVFQDTSTKDASCEIALHTYSPHHILKPELWITTIFRVFFAWPAAHKVWVFAMDKDLAYPYLASRKYQLHTLANTKHISSNLKFFQPDAKYKLRSLPAMEKKPAPACLVGSTAMQYWSSRRGPTLVPSFLQERPRIVNDFAPHDVFKVWE